MTNARTGTPPQRSALCDWAITWTAISLPVSHYHNITAWSLSWYITRRLARHSWPAACRALQCAGRARTSSRRQWPPCQWYDHPRQNSPRRRHRPCSHTPPRTPDHTQVCTCQSPTYTWPHTGVHSHHLSITQVHLTTHRCAQSSPVNHPRTPDHTQVCTITTCQSPRYTWPHTGVH